MPFETLAGGLQLVIPTNGTRNWGTVLKNSTWVKINNHSHTGSGDGNKLGKASLNDSIIDQDLVVPNFALKNAVTLTPSGTTETIDFDSGNNQILDLSSATGDVTLTLSNPIAGAKYRVKLIQGATPRLLIWPAAVLFQGNEEPAQFQVANDIGVVYLDYDGANYLTKWEIDYS